MNERIRFDEEQFLKLIGTLNKLNDTLDKLRETFAKVGGIHVHYHYKIEPEKMNKPSVKNETWGPNAGTFGWIVPYNVCEEDDE